MTWISLSISTSSKNSWNLVRADARFRNFASYYLIEILFLVYETFVIVNRIERKLNRKISVSDDPMFSNEVSY